MERLAQFLDDLDDLIGILALVSERIRKAFYLLLFASVAVTIQVGGVLLALVHPPLALGLALILGISWLYRSVTSQRLEIA